MAPRGSIRRPLEESKQDTTALGVAAKMVEKVEKVEKLG